MYLLRKYRPIFIIMMASCISAAPASHGLTNIASPTSIAIVQNSGLVISGAFGDPGGCGNSDHVFVALSHPRYQEIVSSAMTALASGMKIQVYIHSCAMVGWYGFQMNQLSESGTLQMTR